MGEPTTVDLVMPWPPSVNGYWRSIIRGKGPKARPSQIKSERGRKYLADALEAIEQAGSPYIAGEVSILEVFYPPCRRRRDMDNHRKALRDALTTGGVIDDDSMIRVDHGEWREVDTKNPRVEVRIERKESK